MRSIHPKSWRVEKPAGYGSPLAAAQPRTNDPYAKARQEKARARELAEALFSPGPAAKDLFKGFVPPF